MVGAVLAGWAVTAWLVDLSDVAVVEPAWRDRLVLLLTAGAAVVGAVLALLARRRPGLAADAGAVAAAVLLGAAGTAALHGTRWGWHGLYADSSFRTQMATRFAETPALVDYGYRDLPAYYPPALAWLQGRLAAVTDLAGWEAVKPVQLLVGVLVPLAAYLLWRPVVGALPASAVAGLVTVVTAHPQKPDEWLVLSCLLPWWLLTVRDLRAPGVPRWPAWRLGVVLGLLLLVHTYWFLPFGLATLLALAYDGVRARTRPDVEPRLPIRRALAIGAVGLAVSAVSWAPAVLARLRLPTDDLQLRYSFLGGNEPPLPSLSQPVELAGLVGLAWLGWAAWRRLRGQEAGGRTGEVAGALGLALAGCLITLWLGALAERADVGFLAFKTRDAVTTVLLAAGVLGVADWLRRWHRRQRGRRPVPAPRLARIVPVVLAGAAAAGAAYHLADEWVTGRAALVAQTTRYPDGTLPTGDPAREPVVDVLFVDRSDPSVEEIEDAWEGLRPDVPIEDAVLVTSQVDLLATTPVHGFVAYKSIYSHPNGRFEDRVALLEEVADCPTSACAAELLQEGPDPVDGLVLQRDESSLVLPLMVDDFPDRTRRAEIEFPDGVLRGPEFERTELGRIVVIALRPPAATPVGR
jgi:galactan 5-O-arabinofuranosyltransferase